MTGDYMIKVAYHYYYLRLDKSIVGFP